MVIIDAKFDLYPQRRKIAGTKQFTFDSEGKFTVFYKNSANLKKSVAVAFVIPEGFICDSTSLPWAIDYAGDAHDYGYCIQGENSRGYDKEFWDKVFYYLMLDIGMPKWRAKIRYRGVRMFGGISYRKRRAEKYQFVKMTKLFKFIDELGI